MRSDRMKRRLMCALVAALVLVCPAAWAAGSADEGFKTLGEYVWAAGWIEIVILAASVVAFVALVDCFLRTRRSVTVPEMFLSELRRHLTADGPAKAAAVCAGRDFLVAEALRVGFRRAAEGLQVMEAGAYQALEEGLASLYARLALPLGIAVIAPLVGLLGAVLALVEIFARMMSLSPPTTADVARGVVGALVPFASGLLLSVAVMIAYFWLRRRIARVGLAASAPLREFLEEAHQRREP